MRIAHSISIGVGGLNGEGLTEDARGRHNRPIGGVTTHLSQLFLYDHLYLICDTLSIN